MDVWVKIMDGRRTIVQISEMKVLRFLMADVTLLIWRETLLQRPAEQPFFFGACPAAAFSSDFSLEILEAPPLHGDDKEEIAEIEVHGVTYG